MAKAAAGLSVAVGKSIRGVESLPSPPLLLMKTCTSLAGKISNSGIQERGPDSGSIPITAAEFKRTRLSTQTLVLNLFR